MADPRKWKHFERLVAAIHKAADQGAKVRWNELINGRQFDVTIRFKQGLYEYLTVVECKDHARPVPVDKVEAFVTKSRDADAHHGVLASSSGFQEGARQVAEKHNITLIHVSESQDVDLSAFGAHWAGETNALHIQSLTLEYVDGERKRLPEEAHALTYYVNKIILKCGSEQESLDELIQQYSPQFLGGNLEDYTYHVIPCPEGTRIVAPEDGEIPLKPLARLCVHVGMTKARVLAGPVAFEPYLLTPDIKVKNMASGEEKVFSRHNLGLGVDTVLEEGKFYENPNLAMYYYCDKVEGDTATWYLVESYQLGQLIQAQFTQKTKYASDYVEVTDNDILRRLRRRLNRLKAGNKKN